MDHGIPGLCTRYHTCCRPIVIENGLVLWKKGASIIVCFLFKYMLLHHLVFSLTVVNLSCLNSHDCLTHLTIKLH